MQLMTYLGFACQHCFRVLSRRDYELLSKGKGGVAADRNNGFDPHAWRTILTSMLSAPASPWSVERRARKLAVTGVGYDRRDPTACAIAVR